MSSDNEDNGDDFIFNDSVSDRPSARAELSSHEKTECLINIVQKYKLLYDLEDSSHKDKWKTAKAWAEISKETGESGEFINKLNSSNQS